MDVDDQVKLSQVEENILVTEFTSERMNFFEGVVLVSFPKTNASSIKVYIFLFRNLDFRKS